MGVESEGEEERVELDKAEVDLLEGADDGAPGDGDDDAPGDDLPPSDDDEGEEEEEAAGGRADGTAEVRTGPPTQPNTHVRAAPQTLSRYALRQHSGPRLVGATRSSPRGFVLRLAS